MEWGKLGLMICVDLFVEEVKQEMIVFVLDLFLIFYGWVKEVEDWLVYGMELEKMVIFVVKVICCLVIGMDLVGEIS